MAIINLRELYPFYGVNYFIEVSDEVAETLQQLDRQEASCRRKLYRHKAYFSLDQSDRVEHDIVCFSLSPEEILEQKETSEQLYAAMETLSGKQAKRIFAHFFLGLSKAEIARAEGVRWDTVSRSISNGLHKVSEILKKG